MRTSKVQLSERLREAEGLLGQKDLRIAELEKTIAAQDGRIKELNASICALNRRMKGYNEFGTLLVTAGYGCQTLDEFYSSMAYAISDFMRGWVVITASGRQDKKGAPPIKAIHGIDKSRIDGIDFLPGNVKHRLLTGLPVAYHLHSVGTPHSDVTNAISIPLYFGDEVIGAITVVNHEEMGEYDNQDLSNFSQIENVIHSFSSYLAEIQRHRDTLIETVELYDPYTSGHAGRVTGYALAIANSLSLPRDERRILGVESPLHDVGKIGVDRLILNKNGKLSDEEFEIMKAHPLNGLRILYGLPNAVECIRHHHERRDGKGYPDGIGGDDILAGVRAISVADVFDAVTSDRPYRTAMPLSEAFGILSRGMESHFFREYVVALAQVFPNLRLMSKNDGGLFHLPICPTAQREIKGRDVLIVYRNEVPSHYHACGECKAADNPTIPKL